MKNNIIILTGRLILLVIFFIIIGSCAADMSDTSSDFVVIESVRPDNGLIDNTETNFTVIVEYTLVTADTAELNIGFNSESAGVFTIIEDATHEITKGDGDHTFNVSVIVKNWGNERNFSVYVTMEEIVDAETALPLDTHTYSSLSFQ